MSVELLCPECLGTLELLEGGTARCTIHGGEYKVLFHRGPPPAPSGNIPPILSAAPGMCVNHTNLRAAYACSRCGTAICQICAFPQDDDTWLCPKCAMMSASAGQTPSLGGVTAVALAVQDKKCHLHPNVAAVQICKLCGVPMCATCDFAFPGNLHLCPKCATTQRTGISTKRKIFLIVSFVMAAWCTVVMAALLSGAFHEIARDKEGETALGVLLSFGLLVPAIIGTSLGVSSMDRRLPNSVAMWIAVIWNGMILGGYILLMIIGIFMK